MRRRQRELLAIDIGNSTIGLGLYPNAAQGKHLIIEKIPLGQVKSAGAFHQLVNEFLCRGRKSSCRGKPHPCDIDIIISSVVPAMNRRVIAAVKDICIKPLLVDHLLSGGLTFDVPHPEMIGSDRIANALAAFNYFGKPAAIIDFGTATTITVVGKHANFVGGAILPGIDLMRGALASQTAKLPRIPLAPPFSVIGRDTTSAIASGIIHGTAGAVENIIREMEKELRLKLRTILTGGQACMISSFINRDHILLPCLIFEGMRQIFIQNRDT